MKKCNTVAEGVAAILAVYDFAPQTEWQFIPAGDGDLSDTLVVDGVRTPLFWWRTDTQIVQMANLAPSRNPCSMKLNRTCTRKEGLRKLLYRELDIAELMLAAPVRDVMCMKNGRSMNVVATMENERVAVFELAATLHEGTREQGRHTLWGTDGMVSDRVVSQKLPAEALYLFTEDSPEPELYNDIFIYTYGLSMEDATKAACIAEILMGRRDVSAWTEKDAWYRRILAAVECSETACRCVRMEEMA